MKSASQSGSLYAATFRAYPGPGTYEAASSIRSPRSSPRGTFGTGPQRATFANTEGPQTVYSPKFRQDPGAFEHSFPKGDRFKAAAGPGGPGGTGDPGAYNPRPRSETRAPSAYSLGARRATKMTTTPGPGAHEITRFGDSNKFDSFKKPMSQPSPRYSFGSLARPLALSQSAQSLRRTPRSDFKAATPPPGGGGSSTPGSGRRPGGASPRYSSPRHPLVLKKDDLNVYAPQEPAAHLVDTLGPSSGRIGPGAYNVSPNVKLSTTNSSPSYTILTKKEEKRRFISKQHSTAANFGDMSPGPAIYSRHMEIGVGVMPEGPKRRGGAPVLKGEYLRGPTVKPRAPAFGFGTASRDAPGGLVILT
eukprot:SAG22_NODE_1891_length_3372_cov_6.426214_1_plen_362_part_00